MLVDVGKQQARVGFFCHLVGPGDGVQVLRLRLCHLLSRGPRQSVDQSAALLGRLEWWSGSQISISVRSDAFYLTSAML